MFRCLDVSAEEFKRQARVAVQLYRPENNRITRDILLPLAVAEPEHPTRGSLDLDEFIRTLDLFLNDDNINACRMLLSRYRDALRPDTPGFAIFQTYQPGYRR